MATTVMGATEGEGQQQTPPTGTPPADSSQDDSPAGLSVEDVDARWRHRVSQKDKAHAAAEQALREENDKLRRQLEAGSTSRSSSGGQSGKEGGDDAYLREQLSASQRELEQERSLRAIDAKRAKYPALAAQVGDSGSGIFGTADDATLARLNALADDEATGSTFAPTTPRKPAPVQPKPLSEMNKAELEQALKQSIAGGGLNR